MGKGILKNKFSIFNRLFLLIFIISMLSITPTRNDLIIGVENQSNEEYDELLDNNLENIPKDNQLTDDISMINIRELEFVGALNPEQIYVAVLNAESSEEPAYFSGGWANNYLTLFNGLVANGFETKVITNAEILAGGLSDVDVFIMIDNVPSDAASPFVIDWALAGGHILSFDSSICLNTWGGLLPPEAVGTNGQNTWWEYSSPSEGIYYTIHPIMAGYLLGETIYGTSGDSQYFSAAMQGSLAGPYYTPVVKSNIDNDRDLIVAFDPPSQGRIVHIWDAQNWNTVTNQLLIMNSINWLRNASSFKLHDSSVSLNTPSFLNLGEASLITSTIYNTGTENETNVELQLWIDDILVNSSIYPSLKTDENRTIQYLWTPVAYDNYNITAYAVPVTNETHIYNNKLTKFVNVLDPDLTIGIILTHGESMSGSSTLVSFYEGMGYTVDIITDTLTESLLSHYRFLFVGENGMTWLASEITAVENYIASGGVFIGIGDSPATDGVIQIGINHGITFIGDNLAPGGITTNINTGHPMMDGISSIYIPSIFDSLELTGLAVEMFRGPTNVDIIGASVEIGSGLFVALCDDFVGVLFDEDNEIMFANFLTWSSNPFSINITSPSIGERLSGAINVTWNGSDPSGGDLNYSVYLWDYHNTQWLPLIIETNETIVKFNTTLYLDGYLYRIKVEATNGTHSGATATGIFLIDNYEDPPSVMILSPTGGEMFDSLVYIYWEGIDPDLDALTYTIYYREETGSWIEIISGLSATDYIWFTMSIQNGYYYIRIVASDGLLEDEATTLSTIRIQHPNHAPEVTLSEPNDGGIFTGDITISWSGSDIDLGDVLTFNLYYWNEANWIIIATGLSNSSFVWDSTAVPNGDFYRIRVAATDSMAIAFDTSDTAFNVNNKHTGRASVSITTFTISLAMGIMIILMIRKRRK